MTFRHLERKYIELQEAVRNVPGGVGCANDPTLFFPEDLVGSYHDRKDVITQAKITAPPTKMPVTFKMITARVLRAMSNHIGQSFRRG